MLLQPVMQLMMVKYARAVMVEWHGMIVGED
jgi:hypothetical protein